MTVYIFLLLLMPFALYISQPKQLANKGNSVKYKYPFILVVSFIIAILLKGLAYDTGADFLSYYDYIKTSETSHTSEFEFGFRAFAAFIRNNLPVQTFFIIAAFFYYFGALQISKRFIYAAPLIVFFWSLLFFNLSCNLYRQYYSIAFLFIAASSYLYRNYIHALLWAFLSVSFHYSSFIAIPFFLICDYLGTKRIRYWMIAFLIILSSFAGSLFENVINAAYNIYAPILYFFLDSHVYDLSELMDDQYHTSYAFLMSFFFLIWSYFGYKIKDEIVELRPIYYMSVIYFILYPLFQQEIMARLLLYFQMFVPVLYGVVFHHYYTLLKRKHTILPISLLLVSVSIYSFLFVYSLISLLKNYPYQLNL